MRLTVAQEPVLTSTVSSTPQWRWMACAIIALCFLFHMATLRPGHGWSGDFSLYILHARNIAQGEPYTQTPFVYNELFIAHSPRSYPPVYPLLLAPVYAIYGLDYTPMKVLTGLFLPLTWLVLMNVNGISGMSRLLLIAMLAACPLFWQFKDWVIPDFAYMAFVIVVLWLSDRAYLTGDYMTRPVRTGLLVALAMGAAYGTRSLGLVLPIAIAGYDVVRNRRLTLYAVTAVAGFAALVIAMNAWIGRNDQSYMDLFSRLTPQQIVSNMLEYGRSFGHIWYTDLKIAQYGMFAVAAVAAAASYAARVRRWSSPMELLFAGHLALLFIWPAASGDRYILPLIPFFLFYVLAGFELVRLQRAAITFAAVTLLIYGVNYSHAKYGPIDNGPRQATFQQMARYVQAAADPQDLHVFWNPRVLALYTGVRSMTYGPQASADVNWQDFVRKGVRYIVVFLSNPEDQRVLQPIVAAHAAELEQVWSNTDYAVYRVAGQPK
jgi:hypothetical protein